MTQLTSILLVDDVQFEPSFMVDANFILNWNLEEIHLNNLQISYFQFLCKW